MSKCKTCGQELPAVMKFKTTGKSMIELLEIYGKEDGGFYSDWWKDEPFAKEKPPAGKYEINFEKRLLGMTFDEAKKNLPKVYDFPHPAVVLEAIFSHYKKTGERLLEDWWTWTSSRSSVGKLVYVGWSDAGGVYVDDWPPDSSFDSLGVSFSRSL